MFSVKDQPIVAWAGFCRDLPDLGPVFAGMTMEATAAITPTNDHMPVLLDPDEQEGRLDGSVQDVIRFQFGDPFDAHPDDGRARRRPVAERQGAIALCGLNAAARAALTACAHHPHSASLSGRSS